jgi:peroxiredoxin
MVRPLVEGDIFPELKLSTPAGATVDLARLRGEHSIAVLFSGESPNPAVDGFLDRLKPLLPDFEIEGARVILITPPGSPLLSRVADWPVLVLLDEDGSAARRVGAVDEDGRPAPAAFLADRWFEVFDAQNAEDLSPEALLDWLRYVEIQCPE